MVRLWAWSLRQRGGALAQAPVTVTFNDQTDPDTAQWLIRETGCQIRVLPRLSLSHKEANKYNALMAPDLEQANWVVLTDCDVACMNDLAPLGNWLTDSVDAAAAPEGHQPAVPPPGKPAHYKPIRRYGELLVGLADLTPAQMTTHQHPWFTDRWPCTVYPYFNGGVVAVRGSCVKAFRETLVPMTQALYTRARRWHPHPLLLLKRFWNSRVDRTPWADDLCLGPFFRQRYADQVALMATFLKLRLRYTVLPHCFNWRARDMGHGEELPIRLLHYFKPALGVPLDQLFNPDWIPAYRQSDNPGRQALAEIVTQYRSSPAGSFDIRQH